MIETARVKPIIVIPRAIYTKELVSKLEAGGYIVVSVPQAIDIAKVREGRSVPTVTTSGWRTRLLLTRSRQLRTGTTSSSVYSRVGQNVVDMLATKAPKVSR